MRNPFLPRLLRYGLLAIVLPMLTNVCRALPAFTASPAPADLTAMNGTVDVRQDAGVPCYRWSPSTGETAFLSLRQEAPLLARLNDFARCHFEFRLVSGEVNELSIAALGHVSGARQYKVHQWTVALRTTPPQVWQTCEIDLTRPNWFPWDNPDGEGSSRFFRFEALALVPNTVIEIRKLTFQHNLLLLKPDYELPITWPLKTALPDGAATYTIQYHVLNAGGTPTEVTAAVRSTHTRFQVALAKATQPLKCGQEATFTLTATITKAAIDATPELYSEPLQVTFTPAIAPDAACSWQGELVRPLSADIHRQVVMRPEDLATVRAGLQQGDSDMKALVNYTRTIAAADAFVGKQLEHIPSGWQHPMNGYPEGWQPGDRMPEAVNTKTGAHEYGTSLAGQVWKEYLGYSGQVCEHLGMAYLLSGDEKYAKKAIELFTLYTEQYPELPWHSVFDPPWNAGPAILSSSRTSSSSTYGSNWYFKGHCRLLSMIADSPSWTTADRQRVYQNFVLPYATEIMKFAGGLSNMTDITNHNVLLLGIVHDDAGLVRWATMRDAGLLTRLRDIDADGFSSEGRPINYHLAEMTEYVPAISYLANAGIAATYPKEKLLAAIRMPFQRATLTGQIPNTGDCGRWQGAGPTDMADQLISIFPQEKWLTEVGAGSTLTAKLQRKAAPVAAAAWRQLLETTPRLFAEAGMAVLRQGTTPETQIMVTLDYGRNLFHSALDRNQLTLSAFGAIFSHGPGSLYNAGSGGMTRATDARLDSFCSHESIGHNVVLVDQENQLPAVGKLLAWSPQPDYQVAVSRVDGIRPGVNHTRGVVLTQGIVILLDRLESTGAHTYDFAYHNLGQLTLGDGWTATAATQPLGNKANYASIVDVERLRGDGPIHLTWMLPASARQQRQLRLALWQLPLQGGNVYAGKTGMNNPQTATVPDAAPSLFHRVSGKTVTYLTVLEPYGETPNVTAIAPVRDDGVLVTLANGKQISCTLNGLLKQYAVK